MDVPTALGDIFQYEQSKKEMSLQQQEFSQSMKFQRQEEQQKVIEQQKESVANEGAEATTGCVTTRTKGTSSCTIT